MKPPPDKEGGEKVVEPDTPPDLGVVEEALTEAADEGILLPHTQCTPTPCTFPRCTG